MSSSRRPDKKMICILLHLASLDTIILVCAGEGLRLKDSFFKIMIRYDFLLEYPIANGWCINK